MPSEIFSIDYRPLCLIDVVKLGGWYCFDNASCQARWTSAPHLMSSAFWPQKRRGTGILSTNSEENPYIHDANLVSV